MSEKAPSSLSRVESIDEALQESDALYRTVAETASDAIITINEESTILLVNRAAERIFGYSVPEMLGQHLTLLMPEYLRHLHRAGIKRYLETNQRHISWNAVELPGLHKDGHEVQLELSFGEFSKRGKRFFTGIVRDISYRKRMEVERQAVFEIIQGAITTINLDEMFSLIHRAIGRVLYAENCFIALYDPDTDFINFEFWADKFDPPPPPRPVGIGFSSYVLRTSEPLLLTEELTAQMIERGEVKQSGSFSPSWLGVPLRTASSTIGVLAVQHYEDRNAYSELDLEFLSSVGNQVALAIERKRAETTLRESAEKYQTILEAIEEGYYETDLAGNFTFFNDALIRLLGYSKDELMGMNNRQYMDAENAKKVFQTFQRVYTTGKPAREFDWEVIRKDGIHRSNEGSVSLRRDAAGQPVGFRGIVRDVTERKQAEAALKESEERYRTLVERSPEGIAVHSEGKILYINAAGTKLLGAANQEELIGTQVLDLVHPDYRETVENRIRQVLEEGKQAELTEEKFLRLDGQIIDVEVAGIPIIHQGMPAIQVIIRDITERKRTEGALRETEEQLRQSQKIEAVGRLAGGIAHDFNNMLTVINGYSDMLLRELDQGDPLRRKVEGIKKAGERAASLTYQLLAFSRKQVLQPKVVDLNTIISDIDKMLQRLIGEDIQLTTVLSPLTGQVKVDPGQISQVLVNLAVNARDAMPQGGKLIIETANFYMDQEYARQHFPVQPGSYVMLAISDTGSGMDAETQKRVFEPFFTTKEVGKGTGLGLSMVYGTVKQSGGFVWVYSEVGVGTTFKIYLPLVEEKLEGAEAGTASSDLLTGTEKILLVEDEDMVRRITRDTLEMSGYEVLEARDGAEAIAICEQEDCGIDLLITDVVMPRMSGRELAERLAVLRPGLRVLYMSGYTDNAIVHHGVLEAGISFLGKPFTANALAHKVREVLDAPWRGSAN